VDDLERELQSDPLRKALVTVADVSRVLRNSYSSGNPLISAMQALPDQQKLILCVAAISVKHTESKEALTIARVCNFLMHSLFQPTGLICLIIIILQMRQLYKVFAPRLHLPDVCALARSLFLHFFISFSRRLSIFLSLPAPLFGFLSLPKLCQNLISTFLFHRLQRQTLRNV
jgi:hypothetical protein